MPEGDAEDRRAAEDVILRFGLAIDLRDWTMFRSCLADRVLMDLDPRVGDPPDVHLPAKAIVANAEAEFGRYDHTQHHLSVVSCVIDSAGAAIRTNFIASHYREDVPGDRVFVQRGLYLHRLDRSGPDGAWVITEWHQDVRWSEGNRAVMDRDD